MYYQQQQDQGDASHKSNSKVVFETVHWQLTDSAIKVLVENQSKDILSSILTQGILNKIVPPLVIMAMNDESTLTSSSVSASFVPARVYQMLVRIPPPTRKMTLKDPLFRPTLQLALHDVLIPMIEKILSCSKISEAGREVLSVTLEWILKSVLQRGNPKTCFQLLATQQMLASFSRLNSYLKGQNDLMSDEILLLRRLISQGILSAEHHLIEFLPLLKELPKDQSRSKKKVPYQQEFMNIFQSHLSPTKDKADQEALSNLLALLLEEFILELNQLRKQTGSSTHPHSAFHMFRQLSQFALERTETFSSAAWKAIKDMTGLLITHNIYIPSQDDANQSQFLFLSRISASMIGFFAGEALPDSSLFMEMIVTMQNLIELNHELLHKDLESAIIASCMEQYDEDLNLLPTRKQFWIKTVDTYRKLRQQSHLVKCMLNAVRQNERISFSILDQPDVASVFAISMESSPIAEVQTVFHSLEAWFADDSVSSESLQKATEIAVLVFRTTCVTNESTADALSSLVHEFSQTVIIALTERNSICALKLCAWLIHLQGQCAFWLGREHQLKIPHEVQRKLSDHVAIGNCNVIDEALLLLISHRLEQLVSIMHDKEVTVLYSKEITNDLDQSLSKLHAEGKRLASLMSRLSDYQICAVGQLARSGWLYIARCVHVWAVFAEHQDSDNFLRRLLSAIAQSHDDSASSMEERNVALTLMGEVAFLDLFVDRIPIVSYAQLALLFVEQSNSSTANSKSARNCPKVLKTLNAIADCTPCMLGIDDIQAVFVQENIHFEKHAFSGENLLGIHAMLQFVNSLPWASFSEETIVGYLNTLMFLERFCSSAGRGDDKALTMLKILTSLRHALNQVLISQIILKYFQDNPKSALSMLDYFSESTNDFSGYAEIGDQIISDYLSSTSDLLCILTEIVLATNSIEVSKKVLHQILTKFDRPDRRSELFSVLVSRAILRGTHKPRFHIQEEKANAKQGLQQIWHSSWSICKLSLASNASLSHPDMHKRLSYLFLGDLLILANTAESDEEECVIHEIERVLKKESKEVASEVEAKRAQIYLYSCLAKVRPTLSSPEFILAELSSSSIESRYSILLEAAFCQLLEKLDPVGTEDVLQTLVEHDSQDREHEFITIRFKLLTLLLECAHEASTLDCLSSHARGILMEAIEQMTSTNQGNQNLTVVASNKLLRALIRRKDILVLNDQDLHHILTATNQVVGGSISSDKASGPLNVLDCDCFLECCKTLLLLLQRCIKQLYPAVHLVVSLLYSLMESILQITEDQAESLFLEKRCNEFTRLCEMLSPHKDVYKKHVVGLVLFFVNHLVKEKDHSLTVKNAVLPAVHCLLDTFSEYETSQLNALMNTSAKSTFRSIYQSYRKFHAYKGG